MQQAKKKKRDILFGKKEMKLSVFSDDIIFYVENPRESTKKATRTFE